MKYSQGSDIARMVTAEDGRFRMGFVRYSPGVTYERALWFDEVFYIIKGGLNFTYRSYIPPNKGKEKNIEVEAGEAVFMSRGTWMKWRADFHTEIFYVAIPSSSRNIGYRIREEVNPKESHLRTG